jgi:uncharacterized protein (DUF58 family)
VRAREAIVPLLPRRRVHGTPLGDMRSGRRGDGAELVGLREYRRGDDPRRLDHRASARASLVRAGEILLVREYYAEEAARVVLVVDRRPSMSLFPENLPWLHKPAAVREIVRLVADSAFEARSPVGCLEVGAGGETEWWPPARHPHTSDWLDGDTTAGVDSLTRAFEALSRMPRLGKGTFVFVVSDFLAPPDEQAWWLLQSRGWDPVPVLVQDARWERSFPSLAGMRVPLAEADGEQPRLVRLTRGEAARLRARNVARWRTTLERMRALTFDPIPVDSHEPDRIHRAFQEWASGRGGRLR